MFRLRVRLNILEHLSYINFVFLNIVRPIYFKEYFKTGYLLWRIFKTGYLFRRFKQAIYFEEYKTVYKRLNHYPQLTRNIDALACEYKHLLLKY